jgi:uncharacterized protein YbjT (DUF2867 family)
MLLVTGATGNVGSAVLAELANGPHHVRAFVRDPARLAIAAPNIEVVVGDFADDSSLARAFEGVESAFLASALDVRMPELQKRFIGAAERGHVKRVVQLSAIGANASQCCVRALRWLGQVEDSLKRSSISTTHLRAASFYQNLLTFSESIASQGVIAGPFRAAAWPMVDARDVGAVAAAALTDAAHAGQSYEVMASQNLTYHDIAQRLGTVLETPVRYVDVSANEARGRLNAAGKSPVLIEAMLELWDAVASGYIKSEPSNLIERITGRPARTLEDFARDYRSRFARAA